MPFYQKPDYKNSNKVINADLLFPSIVKDSFGGEIVGCGQRQENTKEMIERFIAWALGKHDIKDVIIYPRLKNVITYP